MRETLIGAVVVLVQGFQQQLVGVGEPVGAQGRQVVGTVTALLVTAQQVTVPLTHAGVEGDHLPGALFEGAFHAVKLRVEEPATIIGAGDTAQTQAGTVFLKLCFAVQLLDLQHGVVIGVPARLALGGIFQFQFARNPPAPVELPAACEPGLGGDLGFGANVAGSQLAVAQKLGLEGQARAQLEAGLLPFDGFLGVGAGDQGRAQRKGKQGAGHEGDGMTRLLCPLVWSGLENGGSHANISESGELLNDFRKEAGPSGRCIPPVRCIHASSASARGIRRCFCGRCPCSGEGSQGRSCASQYSRSGRVVWCRSGKRVDR